MNDPLTNNRWEKARTTEEAVEQLRAARHGVGIILPSLRVDPWTGSHGEPYALADLGRCNLGVASRLAAALRARGDDCPAEAAESAPPGEVLRERVRQLNREARIRK
ncbi:hypothetical protein [Streptomyces sp. NPDC006739]|uniref:hypothetical protein n=1 Tax=Streptomyces sp. NPDC006739 TaxID=3364763 RepID=UPI0036B6B057